jgi:hypothetical protein
MEAFAAATVIFLLVCVLSLIGVVVFFSPKTTSDSSQKTPDKTQPGGSNTVKVEISDRHIYGADVNYPLSSSGSYYRHRDDNNFWDNIYNQIYGQIKLDSTLSTVTGTGSSSGNRPGSNAYIDPLLSRASGQTSNAFMDYDVNSHEMAIYNPY